MAEGVAVQHARGCTRRLLQGGPCQVQATWPGALNTRGSPTAPCWERLTTFGLLDKRRRAQEAVAILGRAPFHDTALTTCGDLSYVGGNWTRDIAFAGTSIPLTVRAAALGAEWGLPVVRRPLQVCAIGVCLLCSTWHGTRTRARSVAQLRARERVASSAGSGQH